VLIEQYPEHYPDNGWERPASTVLFAVTLSEVFRRFDCFDVGHLLNLLPSSSGGRTPASSEGDEPMTGAPALNAARSRIAVTFAKIEALNEMQKRGLVDEQHITALKLRVIEQLMFGDDAGNQS
jgi:hypothetical protein